LCEAEHWWCDGTRKENSQSGVRRARDWEGEYPRLVTIKWKLGPAKFEATRQLGFES
jgi:hypothetical protein